MKILYLTLFFVLSYNLRCRAYTLCSFSNYDPGSQFQTNLKQLFPALINSTPPKLFYNVSFGAKPDQVFGLALCRGDSSPSDCERCLNQTNNAIKSCQNNTTGVVWYNRCMLRYSDKNIFTVANTSYGTCFNLSSTTEPNPDRLTSFVTTLLTNLSIAASRSSKLFAVGKVNFDNNTVLYGLAECTKDLSAGDCYKCLSNNTIKIVTTKCNKGKRGAKIIGESCYLWYNDTRYYNSDFVNVIQIEANGTVNGTALSNGAVNGTNSTSNNRGKFRGKTIITIAVSGVAGLVIVVTSIIFLWKRIKKNSSSDMVQSGGADEVLVRTDDNEIRPDTCIYSFEELKAATENFSSLKKLGEGGYGEVYQGMIDGNLVAVKRLFKASKENEQKLVKELSLVSNIEHPNILKLLGYCFEENQYLFVYEYMSNGSLDKYLKDPDSRRNLNWLTRFKIIKGIAHGLFYLHNGLEKNMIHVDLKLPNILLGKELTAKIADFDLLRAFEIDETHQSTENGYGTPGYMAPEVNLMAPRKCYSVKSDVYSFGIMVLEIVTGERIHTYVKTDSHPNLMSFVWYHWNRKKQQEVIDPHLDFQIRSSFEQIVRCIHIGLLCIQHIAAKRPDMLRVVDMLNSKRPLPAPSIPGFLHGGSSQSAKSGFLKSVLRL